MRSPLLCREFVTNGSRRCSTPRVRLVRVRARVCVCARVCFSRNNKVLFVQWSVRIRRVPYVRGRFVQTACKILCFVREKCVSHRSGAIGRCAPTVPSKNQRDTRGPPLSDGKRFFYQLITSRAVSWLNNGPEIVISLNGEMSGKFEGS